MRPVGKFYSIFPKIAELIVFDADFFNSALLPSLRLLCILECLSFLSAIFLLFQLFFLAHFPFS